MATGQTEVLVSVRVLGEVAIDIGGTRIALPGSLRAVALLGWLAIHAGQHTRGEVASSLWPDMPDSAARRNMRTALWALRRALGEHADHVLGTSRDQVGLRNVLVDLGQFDELIAADRQEEALAMFSGELLAGIDDEWAMLARAAHRERVISLLADSSEKASANGNLGLAVARARQAAELNPLSESCARLLMHRYEEAGDRSVALTVYSRIVDRLRRELEIAPSEETWRLAAEIRARRAEVPRKTHVAKVIHRYHAYPPLVGRESELEALGRAWRCARSGAGGVAIIRGDAGIGKTRLVAELSELAEHHGALTATGATSSIGCPPYWPWAELGGALLRAMGGVPEGETFMTALAPLLPNLVQPTAPGPPDFERARLTEGLLRLLEYAAARSPVLVVLEDLHDCDEASALVLTRACRRVKDMPILLVWTRRDRRVPSAVTDAERVAHRDGAVLADIHVNPLADDEVAEIARDAGVSDGEIDTVVGCAAGNALLAVEVARAIARGDTAVTQGLRSTVRTARSRLPAAARALCEAVAVAGRALTVEDARGRAGIGDEADLDAAFDEASDAALLRVTDGMVDFRHALIRDAYYADLPELRRIRLHAAAAHDIEQNGEPELAAEAAAHLQAAGNRDEAARLLIRAAGHALSLGALSRSEELLGQAAELQPRNVQIVLDLAAVAAHRGMASEAQARFDHAVAALDADKDPISLATAHIRWAECNTGPLCRPLIARRSLCIALAILDGAGVSALDLRLRAQAFLALCEAMAGDPEASERLLETIAPQCLQLPNDPIRDIRRHLARTLARIRQGRLDGVADAGRSAAAIARSIGRADLLHGALLNSAAGLAATGAYGDALQLLDEIGILPSSIALPPAIEADVQLSRAWLLSRLDRHDQARRVAASAQRLADRIGGVELTAIAAAEAGRVLLRAGSYDEAEALLADALTADIASIGRPLARLQRAEALARAGRLEEARRELTAAALEPVTASDWPDTLVARTCAVRGLICAAEGDFADAERQLQRAAAGWRLRVQSADATGAVAALADMGRPVIGQISPATELDAVLDDLAQLEDRTGDAEHF